MHCRGIFSILQTLQRITLALLDVLIKLMEDVHLLTLRYELRLRGGTFFNSKLGAHEVCITSQRER